MVYLAPFSFVAINPRYLDLPTILRISPLYARVFCVGRKDGKAADSLTERQSGIKEINLR
jgi:hypothetical protein